MIRRQSNKQWSGGTATHPAPKNSQCKNPLASILWDQDGILLTDYLAKGQTINAECYSSLLVQFRAILKKKRRGKVTKGVLILHNAPAHWTLATQKKLAYLGFQCLDHPPLFSGSGPVGLLTVPWTEKTIERLSFFVRRGHLPRRPGWTDKLLHIF